MEAVKVWIVTGYVERAGDIFIDVFSEEEAAELCKLDECNRCIYHDVDVTEHILK